MKLEVNAASKGHKDECDHLAEIEGAEKIAPPTKEPTRENGRKNPVAKPLEPVDLAVLAKKDAPKAPPAPSVAPAPPSKETVRERLAAALRGELTRSMSLRKEEAAPVVKPAEGVATKPAPVPVAAKQAPTPVIAKPTPAPVIQPPPAPIATKPSPSAQATKATTPPATKPPQVVPTPAKATASVPPKPTAVAPPAPTVAATSAPASKPQTQALEPTKSKVAAASPAPKMEEPAKGDAKAPAASPPPKRPMQVRFTGMKPLHVVEAALFAAGKPVSVEEIAETTGLTPENVKQGIKDLQKDYEGRDTMLEVGKAGTKWGMHVKQQAAEPAAKFAPMEIAPKLLKTLALIAYHQPLKQSELVDMLGTKVYDHVPELVERGLVRSREEGVTKILTTTAAFPEYFGLDAAGPDEVRKVMGKLVGIEAPSRKKAEVDKAAPEPTEVTTATAETPEPSAPTAAAAGTDSTPASHL